MTIISQDKNSILPINTPANAQYGFSLGSSVIQFLIPQSPTLLLSKTLRLNGKLRLNRSNSTFDAPVLPSNLNLDGNGAYELRLNERVGLNALFDTITISGLGSGGQTLESLRNLGRLTALTKPLTHNQHEYDGKLNGQDCSLASRKNLGAVNCNTEVFFSIPIETGLTMGTEALPLGNNGLRGMEILITLANDKNVLICPTAADKQSAFYSLLNLELSYDTLSFDAETTKMMDTPRAGAMEYNSWSHQYQVINSSDTQLNLNFGTSKTLSVLSNTLPTTFINNVEKDSMATDNFVNQVGGVYNSAVLLNKVVFGRDGIRLPLDYEIQCADESAANRPRVELIEELKGSMDVSGSAKTLISVNTENQLKTKVNLDGNEVASLDPAVNVQSQNSPVFGLAVSEDSLTKVGRDFSTSTFTMRIESSLNGNSPQSMNVFTLSKNLLNYTPTGISVSS